jgi:beta-galactosidase/beta-glucuronidase
MRLAVILLAVGAVAVGAVGAPLRQSLSLDGGGWRLQLDPTDAKVATMAANGSKVDGPVQVPGAWAAQGFGEETASLHSQYFGVAFYSRTVVVPPSLRGRAGGNSLWLIVERPQRSVSVMAGSTFVGNHTGYLGKFEGEVTHCVSASSGSLSLNLTVDAKPGETDGLEGTADLVLDEGAIGGWGGIGGHVWLESRPKAWIVNPHIQHFVPASLDRATVNASVTVGGSGGASGLALRVTWVSATNTTVGQAHAACTSATVCGVPDTALSSPQLWSPRSPTLYSAQLELTDSSGETVYDSTTVTFGVKRFEIIPSTADTSPHFMLNGEYLYLHGYGDDAIYPMSISPPLNHTFYLERLKVARALGFNFVRHHTNILPDEYFHAASEVGMLIQAEFPMFGGRIGCDGGNLSCAKNPVYFEEWRTTILRLRNFPCVFDYTMTNEGPLLNHEFAMQLYNTAKALDPTRPVSTSDGIGDDGTSNHSNPYDWLTPGYEGGAMPLDNSHLYRPGNVSDRPFPQGFKLFNQPLVNHETGNIGSFPDVEAQIPRWTGGPMKPWWLTPVRDSLASRGLLGGNSSEEGGALWAARSNRMFVFAWKDRMEAMRKTEQLSGYEWWLLQDCASAPLDSYAPITQL